MLKALIFDFDGLILDTETPLYDTWRGIYAEFGVELPLEVWAACLGTSPDAFDPISHLESLIDTPVDRTAVSLHHKTRSLKIIANQPTMPGVAALLAHASQARLGVGLASSSPRGWVTGHLRRLGLISYFDSILCAEDVTKVKPAPDLFQLAAQKLGADPIDAAAFEDSPNGIISAQAAGIFCVGVPNRISRFLEISHADWVIPGLDAYPPSILLDQIQSKMNHCTE